MNHNNEDAGQGPCASSVPRHLRRVSDLFLREAHIFILWEGTLKSSSDEVTDLVLHSR